MKAMVIPETGGPDVFEYRDWPDPDVGPGQVGIDVEFIGVNFTDVRNRRGDGMGTPPMVVGVEAAGRVRSLGEGVSDLEVGQYVVALTGGNAYAQIVSVPALRVFPVPDELVGEPVTGGMSVVVPVSMQLLRNAGRVLPDETMLVHGAAGGIGTALVQVASALGLGDVYGTVSTEAKRDYAMGFGFADVFVRDDFVEQARAATGGRGIDVIFDPVGGDTRARSFDLLADFGRLVHFGNASMEPEVAPDALTMRSRALGYVGYSSAQHFMRDAAGARAGFFEAIDLVASGRVRIDVTEVFDWREASRAHELLESGAAVGKYVLAVDREG